MSWQNRLWVEGYDSRLVPRAPFEIGRLSSERDRIVFVHSDPAGPKRLMVAPDEGATDASTAGPTGMALGPGTSSPDDVLALIEDIPFQRGWSLASRYFYLEWPRELTVWSTPTEVSWPFEMTIRGDELDEMIYVQGPFRGTGPEPAQLVGGGMSSAGSGELRAGPQPIQWIELAYEHAGEPWRQRRCWVRLQEGTFLVTSQARLRNGPRLFELADRVSSSLRYREIE